MQKSTINKPVFFVSAGLLLAFVGLGVSVPGLAKTQLPKALDFVSKNFGWLYVTSVAIFGAFCVWLLFSRYRHVRLGPPGSRPEYSNLSWFAMLFSAGMGIGLVFFGVAEPIIHYSSGPAVGSTQEAASRALPLTFFHWGVQAWAIYAVMGVSIAYFHYRRGLPLSLRSCFYPLLGERIHSWPGHIVDILAVLGTLFGLATSLGLGAMQVSDGLHRLTGVSSGVTTQLILIAFITAAATVSLLTGLDKGIRRLSEANLAFSIVLLAFVVIAGPTVYILDSFVEGIGRYVEVVLERTLRLGIYNEKEEAWTRSWTIFYWGWWISWAPFVGIFIARISRGRTLRQFLLGILLVPSLLTFFWFAAFGGTALHHELTGAAPMAAAVENKLETAVYVMLEALPFSSITTVLAALVVMVYFVTSSDSASFVVDMLTSGGHPNPPKWQRVFWACAEGAVAATLLYAAGRSALRGLQAGVITIALPFCFVMLLLCVSLVRSLREHEHGGPLEDEP